MVPRAAPEVTRLSSSLTDLLCTRCGLCCNGSLFADVELAGDDEVSALEILGLEIEDADEDHRGLLLQPCAALKGRRCGIYTHRPDCCRAFECRLLQRARRGLVDVDRAREQIAETLQRIARIESHIVALGRNDRALPLKERCAEALARSAERDSSPGARRKRDALGAEMAALERRIRTTFLGG
jgi:uncharacterized protein